MVELDAYEAVRKSALVIHARLRSRASVTDSELAVQVLTLLGDGRRDAELRAEVALAVLGNQVVTGARQPAHFVAAKEAAKSAISALKGDDSAEESAGAAILAVRLRRLIGQVIHLRGDYDLAAAYHQASLDRVGAGYPDELLEEVRDQRSRLSGSLYLSGESRASRRLADGLFEVVQDGTILTPSGLFVVSKQIEHHLQVGEIDRAVNISGRIIGGALKLPAIDDVAAADSQVILWRDIGVALRAYGEDEQARVVTEQAMELAVERGLSNQVERLRSISGERVALPRPRRSAPPRGNSVLDYVVLTVRPDELRAALTHIGGTKVGPASNTMWEIRSVQDVSGRYLKVLIAATGKQGNTRAQMVLTRILREYDPRRILLVGIAGAVPTADICLGDVIVPREVLDFSVSAALAGGGVQHAVTAARGLDEFADLGGTMVETWQDQLPGWPGDIPVAKPPVGHEGELVVGSDAWVERVRETLRVHESAGRLTGPPRAVSGTMGTSSQLIKDPAVVERWLHVARDLLAVEMESGGILAGAAAWQRSCLVVRGISDVVGLRRDERWTSYACHSAAVFASGLVRSGILHDGSA